MGLINWIFDFYQHSRINDAHRQNDDLRAHLRELRQQNGSVDQERLVRAVGELALAVKTLQRAVLEKGLTTEAELRRIAQDIDRADGRLDGQTPL